MIYWPRTEYLPGPSAPPPKVTALSTLICGENLSMGWLRAIAFLLDQPGGSTINLLVDLEHPLDEDGRIRTTLDELLTRRKLQPVDTVANTIFPEYLYNSKQPIERLFQRYERIMPRLRRSGNPKGTYFWRLTHWVGRDGVVNQLQEVIERLRSENRGRKLPAVYELVVYSPGVDRRPIGFPCLSYVSLKLLTGSIHMTAVYRSHYFIERAYGNYLGLARLQQFIARSSGLHVGSLSVLSTKAALDVGKTIVRDVLRGSLISAARDPWHDD